MKGTQKSQEASTTVDQDAPPAVESPPDEAPPSEIARLLREARGVGVFCGEDVDMQTCKFFAHTPYD
jgi:hypothetical protein